MPVKCDILKECPGRPDNIRLSEGQHCSLFCLPCLQSVDTNTGSASHNARVCSEAPYPACMYYDGVKTVYAPHSRSSLKPDFKVKLFALNFKAIERLTNFKAHRACGRVQRNYKPPSIDDKLTFQCLCGAGYFLCVHTSQGAHPIASKRMCTDPRSRISSMDAKFACAAGTSCTKRTPAGILTPILASPTRSREVVSGAAPPCHAT